MYQINCRHFSGYKPCEYSQRCDEHCRQRSIPTTRVLLVHLGALGAVVRATSLLPAIRRRYPNCHLTWITDAPAHHLLKENSSVDRVLTSSSEDQLILRTLKFDVALVVDKSLKASGLLRLTSATQIFGFLADEKTGSILPATPAADELWRIGLDNDLKFFRNSKPETQLMVEALELGRYERDEYQLPLTVGELSLARQRRQVWQQDTQQIVVGLNTGCSSVIAAKRWTVDYHRQLIALLYDKGYRNIVLLGGPEDSLRNQKIAEGFSFVFQSETQSGLRDGLCSMEACDLVVSGDSLGMHMAIARKKFVVAWFGPTCSHEIDLYDRGVSLRAKVPCSPCWKRACDRDPMCYDRVDLNDVLQALNKGEQWLRNQIYLSKRPSWEISA